MTILQLPLHPYHADLLGSIRAKLAAEQAKDDSNATLTKILSGCVCADMLINISLEFKKIGIKLVK